MTMFNLDHRLKRGVASALAVAIVGGGAAGAIAAGTGGGSQAKPVTAAQPNSFTVRTSAAASVKRPTVRAGLKRRAETAAEDVIAYLEQGRPAKSRAEAKLLKRLTDGKVAAELTQAGVPKVKIQALQQRAERVERLSSGGAPKLDVSLAANQVSQLMPSLYARYKDPVPPAVLRLDYLDREIQLRSMGGQTGQIRRLVAAEARAWSKLRPRLVTAGGATAARQYDAHLRALKRDNSPAALQKQALTGLDIVDLIEKAFLRK